MTKDPIFARGNIDITQPQPMDWEIAEQTVRETGVCGHSPTHNFAPCPNKPTKLVLLIEKRRPTERDAGGLCDECEKCELCKTELTKTHYKFVQDRKVN